MRQQFLVLLTATALAGCAEQNGPAAVFAPQQSTVGRSASVVGSAQFHTATGIYRRMEIVGQLDADGNASGELQWVAGAAIIHGSITCLSVRGNTAWIGGIVDHAYFAGVPAGSEFTMTLIDNGEGHGIHDQATQRPFLKEPGAAAVYCATMPAPESLVSMQHGNIRIQEF